MNASEIRRASIAKAFSILTGGADFEVSVSTARTRAETKTWGPDSGHETRDFIALMLASELLSKDVEDSSVGAAKLLDRTWVTVAKRDGYNPSAPPASSNNPTQANAVAIVAIVIGSVAVAAVLAYLIYRATQVVTAEIALHVASQEMLKAHSDAMTVIEEHHAREAKAGTVLPYDAGELAVLQGLQRAQDAAAATETGSIDAAKQPPGPSAIDGAMIATIAIGAGILYLATRK